MVKIQGFLTVMFGAFCLAADLRTNDDDFQIFTSQHLTCPTWHRPLFQENSTSKTCECGNSLSGVVDCNVNNHVYLLACYCMTQSELVNNTIVGNCLYTCTWKYKTRLSNDTSALDNDTCQPLKRTGQLCGECIPGYAPPIYSYNIECVECTVSANNWLKYIAVAFLPLTLFYLIIVMLRFSVSMPVLKCFILVSQMMTMPGHLRYLYTLQKNYIRGHKVESKVVDIGLSLFSFWNLDFLRGVYDPFCIHPNIQSLATLALDYLTAVYPLLLIFITYGCIKIYDKFDCIRQLLKPVHKCCFNMRKEWNIHRSLTDAFATFLLLSYVKILNISFDLLIPTTIYDINGETNISFLYYSGTIQIFKDEHIPFAMLALFMLIVFNIIPLILLALYPCHCFQRLMNSCKCHCQALHVFMDIFNGCYRTKPVDCRYFSVVYLLVRVVNLAIFSYTLNRFYYPLAAVLGVLTALFVTITQPYKNPLYNRLDTCLLLIFSCTYIPAAAYALSPTKNLNKTLIRMSILCCAVLLSFEVILIVYWAIPHRLREKLKTCIKQVYYRKYLQPITLEEDFLEATDYHNLIN